MIFLLDFEDVAQAPLHSKCIACTESLGPELLVLKSGRQAHLTSKKHLAAVQDLVRARETEAAEAARRLLPPVPAALQLPSQFGADGASTSEPMDVDDPQMNPLDDLYFEDGHFWDSEGQQVFFSAGNPSSEHREGLRVRAQLQQELAFLGSRNHPSLGVTSDSLEDSDSEEATDPTVSDMVTEMLMLGLSSIAGIFHSC